MTTVVDFKRPPAKAAQPERAQIAEMLRNTADALDAGKDVMFWGCVSFDDTLAHVRSVSSVDALRSLGFGVMAWRAASEIEELLVGGDDD